MSRFFLLAALLLAAGVVMPASFARAATLQGDFCYARRINSFDGERNLVFDCNKSGLQGVTIADIYDRGWRVVAMADGNGSSERAYPCKLVIEKQK
ncbi:MAG: hypothetical protein LBD82_08605 [Deltaproteobacteria bacterium]|jgi:hypothetical protein|nr:hypothetical protein [Deltaproteobacteria bacterium]